jgi:hypothetical protein
MRFRTCQRDHDLDEVPSFLVIVFIIVIVILRTGLPDRFQDARVFYPRLCGSGPFEGDPEIPFVSVVKEEEHLLAGRSKHGFDPGLFHTSYSLRNIGPGIRIISEEFVRDCRIVITGQVVVKPERVIKIEVEAAEYLQSERIERGRTGNGNLPVRRSPGPGRKTALEHLENIYLVIGTVFFSLIRFGSLYRGFPGHMSEIIGEIYELLLLCAGGFLSLGCHEERYRGFIRTGYPLSLRPDEK